MVPLCFGIITGMTFIPEVPLIIALIIFAFALVILSLFHNLRFTNYIFGMAIFMAFFACGIILIKNEKEGISELRPEQTTFISTLSDYPVEKENTYMVTVC
jgi:hypothetical protein